MAEFQYRIDDGTWHRIRDFHALSGAIFSMGPKETMEIRQVCNHKKTWVDNGIRICKDCGQHLEVTSYRDW